ncbi:ZmpA/ZmpB/ZmpC family metallo-endopeptidase [Mesomycoplasma ovipneumoniae]|uniref:ZmpA/ZmpB/ZmpC family metallo-endopeptidase n=1 Tax=Mesomycoplasma ovipneumoniae TaxID=29562 RepID=A0AAW6Q7P8_9BACT|nr:ZmpA/ZmpB/ZmpC family metallo-endopeptidase [Mesomycoplasma ovipneumoniae]MDF9627404.1 ZmpA/ZmpB/ZmpC family metallo-endopeptidase [Mesomycoplasma ovipneumoniae]MDO4157485.1 ZmpA/ZmpB/ZmpC family metallo-endopeptidase [Mesomycoplasma ovipneumoniae]MDO4158571.1 ZmpA/ZmpB/ZmpC family metallo-endopeptidase [Mesomycoplasma ovipneumoniae]MDO6821492.1 ZmpA/ZmpB/ZmpC family metallo-endopeptidase [Mesomycoplasma ovipneumoniae]MDO6856089.1 ZmpA/ZmpB/ZmpC family metallo-endopeptidase [Mesomycoplasma 
MKQFLLLKKVSSSLVFLSLSPIVIITACKSEVDKKPTTSKIDETKKDTSKNEISKNDPKNEASKIDEVKKDPKNEGKIDADNQEQVIPRQENNSNPEDTEQNINVSSIFEDKTFLENRQAEIDNVSLKIDGSKIEFKNINSANLYHFNSQDKYVKLLSVDKLDSDLKNYKIKLDSEDLQKNVWLNVKSVEDQDDYYKFVGEFSQNFINILNNGTVSSTFDIYIPKTKNDLGVITTFEQLISQIRANPSGNFKLANDISAESTEIGQISTSYLENVYFSGSLESLEGKNFTIYDLKKPLFDNLNNATIQNINFKNLKVKSINNSQFAVGAIANSSSGSTVNNVHLFGDVKGPKIVGGIIGVLDNNSIIKNSSFHGNIYSSQSAGGLSGIITRGSSIENSYANINITSKLINSDKIGGIVAELGVNSSLKNIVIEGNVLNSGLDEFANSGGLIGLVSTNGTQNSPDAGIIENIYAKINFFNAKPIFGNFYKSSFFDYEKVFKNINFVNNANNESFPWLNIVDENTFNERAKKWKNLNNENIKLKTLNFSYLKGYQSDFSTAYANFAKLLPFYDRYTIMNYAHKVAKNSKLYSKNLLGFEFYENENLVKNLAREKTKVNKLRIYFGDGQTEDFKIDSFSQNTAGITDFSFKNNGTEFIVHPNILISEKKNQLVSGLINLLKTTDLSDNSIFDTQNNFVDNSPIKEQLFIDQHENEVKNDLENIINSVSNNIDIFDLNDTKFTEFYKKELEKEKNSIYIGLNYLYRWYSISDFKDKLLFSLGIYGKSNDSLSLLKDIGKLDFINLKADKTANGYHDAFSKYLKPKSVGDFIEYNYNLFKQKDQTPDKYFDSLTKAYITKVESKSDTSVNKPMIERFKQEEQANKLLPLLTVKDQNTLWFIFTTNSNISGLFSKYFSSSESLKPQIREFAEAAQGYYDVLYRILNEKSKKTMQNHIVDVYDTFGPKNEPGVRAYSLPVGHWLSLRNKDYAAFVPGENKKLMYFDGTKILTKYAKSIFSHESTHTFDNDILLDGYGKRFGHRAESFVRGMFQAPYSDEPGDLAFNFIEKYEGGQQLVRNSSPERFTDLADLEKYYKNLFDIIYLLDLAQAEAIIAKKPSDTSDYRQIKLGSGGFTKNDILSWVQSSEFNSINSIEDLVDKNIVGANVGGDWVTSFGHNDYYTVNFFRPYFGILENTEGVSGGLNFRRVAFELLAEKGYYSGMIPYISAKSNKQTNVPEGLVKGSDTHVLKMIFGDKYKSFSDFKKDMYKQRKDKLNKLKPFSFDFSNKKYEINSFDDLKKVFIDNFDRITTIRVDIHVEIYKQTDEYRNSIFDE